MNKKTKAIGMATILAVGALITNYTRSDIYVLHTDSNIVAIGKGDDNKTIVFVANPEPQLPNSLQAREGITVIDSSPFVFLEEDTEYYNYLPFVSNSNIILDWPSDRDRTKRWRPAPGSVSIGHPNVTAGTLGGRVCYNGNCNCFLSNSHVMGGLHGAVVGDPIYQPGVYDGGTASDIIGNIVAIVYAQAGTNYVDAAIACGTASTVYPEIYGIGAVDNIETDITIGMTATKCGRTTGCTRLTLVATDVCSKIGYQLKKNKPPVYYTYCGQTLWSGEATGGDSGSFIVSDDKEMMALLFAGNDSGQILANPAASVFETTGGYLPGYGVRGVAYP